MVSNKTKIIPVFIPHAGCPYDCIFCNQKKISGRLKPMSIKDIENHIKVSLDTINSHGISKNVDIQLAFYGGSFTAIPMAEQCELLQLSNKYYKAGKINSIRISTRPDYIDKAILENLKTYNVKTVELGIQSMDKDVLAKSLRGHSVEDTDKAVRLLKEFGFNIGLQMMIGLPGDTKDKSINTGIRIAELEPDFVRIYPAVVIRDTVMEKMYYDKLYCPFSIDEAIDICKNLFIIFKSRNIEIIRIGLQSSENISLDRDVITGPWHPSFGELVESSVLKDIIVIIMSKKDYINLSDLNIYSNPSNISKIIGHYKSNIEHIKREFNIQRIRVFGEKSISRNIICIEHEGEKAEFDIVGEIKKMGNSLYGLEREIK